MHPLPLIYRIMYKIKTNVFMRFSLFQILILSVLQNTTHAQTPVNPSTPFGEQSPQGAYQEVHFNPINLSQQYFSTSEQQVLESAALQQQRRQSYPTDRYNYDGEFLMVYFQDK